MALHPFHQIGDLTLESSAVDSVEFQGGGPLTGSRPGQQRSHGGAGSLLVQREKNFTHPEKLPLSVSPIFFRARLSDLVDLDTPLTPFAATRSKE
jgi:hypothetical protein